jgi:hypothetical protein
MIWYLLGMLFTYLAATQEELAPHTWYEVLIVMFIWPVALGFMFNEIRMDIKRIKDNQHTHHQPRQDDMS